MAEENLQHTGRQELEHPRVQLRLDHRHNRCLCADHVGRERQRQMAQMQIRLDDEFRELLDHDVMVSFERGIRPVRSNKFSQR